MSAAIYIRPGATRQCIRCNNFWPDAPPYYLPAALCCAACATKTVVPATAAKRWLFRYHREQRLRKKSA